MAAVRLGQLLFVVGDLCWTVIAEFMGDTPFPSIADVAYLAGYPFIAAALVLCVRLRVRGGDRAGLLDGAILAVGACLVGWVSLVDPVLASAGQLDPLALGISIAYPLMDLLVLGVAFAFLATPGSRTPSFVLLTASLLAILAADVVFAFQTAAGTYVEGDLLDGAWLAAYALAGVAALHPTMRDVAAPHPVPVAWLGAVRLGGLAAAMVVGPGVLLLQALLAGGGMAVLSLGSGLLGILVLVRLALVVRLLAEDVAARRSLEEELSFQAAHDPLTGLANRRTFMARLNDLFEHSDGSPVALLFIDLDDFKNVNDTHGHVAGDQLLALVAARIRAAVRPSDLAARIGGDEFGVVLFDSDVGKAAPIAERLLEAIEQPLTLAGTTIAVGASVGVASCTPSVARAEELIHAGDVAMYRAKAKGKSRYEVFEDGWGRERREASTTPAAASAAARGYGAGRTPAVEGA